MSESEDAPDVVEILAKHRFETQYRHDVNWDDLSVSVRKMWREIARQRILNIEDAGLKVVVNVV